MKNGVAKECLLPGNLVYIKFNKLKVKTRRGKKKNLIREEAVHAVAEEFLDLRLGHHFFFNHWIYLFPVWLKRAADHCNECPLCSNKHAYSYSAILSGSSSSVAVTVL